MARQDVGLGAVHHDPKTIAPFSDDRFFKIPAMAAPEAPAQPVGERDTVAAPTPRLGKRSYPQ